MIRLVSPFITTEEIRKEAAYSHSVQRVIDLTESIKHAHLGPDNSIAIRITNPVNIDTDEKFDSVEFLVTDRYKQQGETWVAGARFAVNLDSVIAALEDVRDRLAAEEQAR